MTQTPLNELGNLYQEVILDHNRAPRNFRKMENPTVSLEGFNPLCGDRLTLFLKMDGNKIDEISFIGSGCAISKASTSLMTTSVKGKTKMEAKETFQKFHRLVAEEGKVDLEGLGKLAVFSGVREFPVRVKCATLAWHTLTAALEGKNEPISTEGGEDDRQSKK